MPKAPANNISVALEVSVFTRYSPNHRGNSLRDGGLFGYYECLHIFILSCKIKEASFRWPLGVVSASQKLLREYRMVSITTLRFSSSMLYIIV